MSKNEDREYTWEVSKGSPLGQQAIEHINEIMAEQGFVPRHVAMLRADGEAAVFNGLDTATPQRVFCSAGMHEKKPQPTYLLFIDATGKSLHFEVVDNLTKERIRQGMA